jgi:LysR family transcriptional regulator for bpeEF and oprC
VPRLPQFCEAYPAISLEFILEDFISGPRRDSMDAMIQVGEIPSSQLLRHRLCSVDYVVAASPLYLRRQGVPATPEELAHHTCLTYRRPRNGQIRQWRFSRGASVESISVAGAITFNSGEALAVAAVSGLGVIQVAEYYVRPLIDRGELVEVLAERRAYAYDISVLFQPRKRMASRLRVFIDFLTETFQTPIS